MVVTAGDSYAADAGFADDASDAMPGLDPAAMPMDGDDAASLEAGLDDGAATPEQVPFSVESLSLTPEQQAALDQHYEALISPRLRDQLETQWSEQRRSLEAKVNAFDRDRRQAANVLAARQRVYQKFFQENGVEERDLKALEYEVSQEARKMNQFQSQQQAQAQQVQQAQTAEAQEFQTWQTEITGMMHQHAQSVGLKPDDPQINKRFNHVIKAAEVWSRTPTPENLELYETLKADHKEWVTSLGKQAQKRAAAKPSSDAVARQRGRGVQNLGRGTGAGAAPLSFREALASVQQANPGLDYTEVHQLANAQFMQSRR